MVIVETEISPKTHGPDRYRRVSQEHWPVSGSVSEPVRDHHTDILYLQWVEACISHKHLSNAAVLGVFL